MLPVLTSLVSLFRNPPPPVLPINIMASYYLHESFAKDKDVKKAKDYARHKLAKVLYKEFSNLEFEVVASSEDHIYYKLPTALTDVFKALEAAMDAEISLLVEISKLKENQ